MKFSTILSTFALASTATASAININMNQEGSRLASRSPAGDSTSGPASLPPQPPAGQKFTDPQEDAVYKKCCRGCKKSLTAQSTAEGKNWTPELIAETCTKKCEELVEQLRDERNRNRKSI
ncbi:hypothetical protein MCOR25_010892 [Pyricularia grisea]|nr:hypothetical protein MCOR25_010892 [Pyricularia grisea]